MTFDRIDAYIAVITFVLVAGGYFFSMRYFKREKLFAKAYEFAEAKRRVCLAQSHKPEKKKALKNQIKALENLLKSYSNRFRSRITGDYKLLFEKAGWNSLNASILYLGAKVFSTIFFIGGAWFATVKNPALLQQTGLVRLGIILAATLAGFRFFDYVVEAKIKLRYQSVRQDLSSALELLVVCTNAGLSIDRSFEQIAQEMSTSNADLCKEFAITAIELGILPSRQDAFRNLAKRLDISLIRGLVTALIQSEEQGTSISHTLKVLSNEFREQKILAVEERAQKLPAILAIPVVLFTLPSLMIMILGPTIIDLVNNTR